MRSSALLVLLTTLLATALALPVSSPGKTPIIDHDLLNHILKQRFPLDSLTSDDPSSIAEAAAALPVDAPTNTTATSKLYITQPKLPLVKTKIAWSW